MIKHKNKGILTTCISKPRSCIQAYTCVDPPFLHQTIAKGIPTMCFIVYSEPQSQNWSSACPHLNFQSLHLPSPVRKRFRRNHSLCARIIPGNSLVGSSIEVYEAGDLPFEPNQLCYQ